MKITDKAVSNFLLMKKLSVKFFQKLVIYKRKRYNYVSRGENYGEFIKSYKG
ncbi:hypothetical protein RU92_GL002047 [Lactococcus cremoris subsp. tructae]|uniref:Uncharacterized protein n=1 Tax=Lactococcus cremoris subsp. tructae TaxID=542833 RepID=A0A2A5STQ4_LACLC|nr:hypothetical protein RU92_GL002047 [Lactococcus cremoris subsp. tructae]